MCKTKRAVGNVLMGNGSLFYSTVVGVRFRIYVNRRHGSVRAWGKLCVYIASRHPSAAGRPMVPCQTLWLIVRWIEGSNLIKKKIRAESDQIVTSVAWQVHYGDQMCWNTEHFDSLSFGIRSSGFWILVYNVYNINMKHNFGFMCFNFPIKYRLNTDIAGINNKGECYFVNVLYDSVCLT